MRQANLTQVKEAVYSVKIKLLPNRTKLAIHGIHGHSKQRIFSESVDNSCEITPTWGIFSELPLFPKEIFKAFHETSRTLSEISL